MSLPFATYHRASQVGEGSFGSVLTVYNDDGEEFALKIFVPENDEEDSQEEEVDEDSTRPIELGALREISCLRLLRSETPSMQFRSIVRMHDIQPEWDEGESDGGAGTAGCLGMAMPLFSMGSLAGAIKEGALGSSRKCKVQIAHDLLAAVAALHSNGIIHRDIKSDNVLLQHEDERIKAVLIDFSLAKPIDNTIYTEDSKIPSTIPESLQRDVESAEHTGGAGTMVYTAPEIFDERPYGKPVDIWSTGVVLLEALSGELIEPTRPRQILATIEEQLEALPEQPLPNLLRDLLRIDPNNRLEAHQALCHCFFIEKFNLPVPEIPKFRVARCLPYSDDGPAEENSPPNDKLNLSSQSSRKRLKRLQFIQKVCHHLKVQCPMTPLASLEYSEQLDQLDDSVDDFPASQSLLHCVVLASRFFELETIDLHELDTAERGHFADWTLEDYVDNEATIFMLLDYCLYPRHPAFQLLKTK